jgi:hypothetical protein
MSVLVAAIAAMCVRASSKWHLLCIVPDVVACYRRVLLAKDRAEL